MHTTKLVRNNKEKNCNTGKCDGRYKPKMNIDL